MSAANKITFIASVDVAAINRAQVRRVQGSWQTDLHPSASLTPAMEFGLPMILLLHQRKFSCRIMALILLSRLSI